MWKDRRNIYEVFRDMINKINDKLPPAQVEQLSKITKFDVRIPMISKNGIPILKEEIMELTKIWKNKELSLNFLSVQTLLYRLETIQRDSKKFQ